MEESIVAKRALGNGRWDRALKKKMVELSVADNYDDAKHEWIATGEVWWPNLANCPDWAANHRNSCLCGHRIVYHFEILNTETGVRECVGSDHINSYLILREISERTGIAEDEITEEMIQEWIDVRVTALKSTAWWEQHGEQFTSWFEELREYDLRVNVRESGYEWDREMRMKIPKTKLRKRAENQFGSNNYKMASIVWRWNHPDNPKNQRDKHGYPNERLWNDIQLFYIQLQEHKAKVAEEDAKRQQRSDFLAKYDAEEAERAEQRRIKASENRVIANSMRQENTQGEFEQMCEYYGIAPFTSAAASNDWEARFLTDIRQKLMKGNNLSDRQLQILKRIVEGGERMATRKQMSYLHHLGYDGEDTLTFNAASDMINEILNRDDE
jgi:hypothetical protein